MCGIIGYAGSKEALPKLLSGLERLEYRGYDSAGVAVLNGKGIRACKVSGPLARLVSRLGKRRFDGHTGIGHTRWATHGGPTEANAHPHMDCTGTVAVVHNGIIENFEELKKELTKKGHRFRSDTDTEVAAHLLEEELRGGGDLLRGVQRMVRRLEGHFAIEAVRTDEPERIVAARSGCPLILGLGDGENFLASDIPAVLPFTRRVVHLLDGETAVVRPEGVQVRRGGKLQDLSRRTERISWNVAAAEKGGHPHFMLKEILEQPEAVESALVGRVDLENGTAKFPELDLPDRELKKAKRLIGIACGTAWHAAMTGQYLIERLARIPVSVAVSSEFRYRDPVIDRSTLVYAVSQSGETADTLAGVRLAQEHGARVLAVCNVVGSSLTREADGVILQQAGPEISVASTKAYTSQLVALVLLAVRIARVRGEMSRAEGRKLLKELLKIPGKIRKIFESRGEIRRIARKFRHPRFGNFMFVGRGVNLPTAFEGALKLKEISYRHAEGYGAGEMKHGPLALVTRDLPVVAAVFPGRVRAKTLSNLQEIRARGGRVISVAAEGDDQVGELSEFVIETPKTDELLSPILGAIPMQLFAYELAVALGRDVDRPRNLAKSVTVE